MSSLKKTFVPVIGAAILSIASLKDGFAQTNGGPTVDKDAIAKNETKAPATFTSNKTPANDPVNEKSAERLAMDYSKNGQGIGFVIHKGKLSKDIPDSTIINRYESYFAKHQVKGKVFIEPNPHDGSVYVAFIKGTDFWGTMSASDLKKNMSDIIKSQQAYDARRSTAHNDATPSGMQ